MREFVAVSGDTVQVTANSVNVRSGPGTSYSSLYRLSSPATATVENVTSNWVQINPSGHQTGWMIASYLEKTAGGSASSFPWEVSTDTQGNYPYSRIINGHYCVYEDPPSIDGVHVISLVSNSSCTVHEMSGEDNTFFVFNYNGENKYLLRKNVDNSHCDKAPTQLFGSGTLSNGSSGRHVITLQHYLNRYLSSRNYTTITVDDGFGNTTKQKVESFQMYMNSQYNAGLQVDGVVGENTRKWLACFVQSELN